MRKKKPKKFSGQTLETSVSDPWEVRFRKARLKCGLSQADLARILHVTPAAVSIWEAGINFPAKKRFNEINIILQSNIFVKAHEVFEPAPMPEHVIFLKKFLAAPECVRNKIIKILGKFDFNEEK